MSSRFHWNRRIGKDKIEDTEASLEEFQNQLFDTLKLPELLGSETELRELWANPMIHRELLKKFNGAGFCVDDFRELIGAKNSDLFDVFE